MEFPVSLLISGNHENFVALTRVRLRESAALRKVLGSSDFYFTNLGMVDAPTGSASQWVGNQSLSMFVDLKPICAY